MQMRFVFMVSGYIGSGKDHFSDYLVKHKNFAKYTIAKELKLIVQKKYKLNMQLFTTHTGKNTVLFPSGVTVRDLLIKEAARIKLENSNDIFIANLVDGIFINDFLNTTSKNPLSNIIISDFRFINEYNYVHEQFQQHNLNLLNVPVKVITIRINRKTTQPRLASEMQLTDFKFTHYINNTTSIANFEKNIDNLIKLYI